MGDTGCHSGKLYDYMHVLKKQLYRGELCRVPMASFLNLYLSVALYSNMLLVVQSTVVICPY